MKTAIGIDYGTNSCRAVVVNCEDGTELGAGAYEYEHGIQGVIIDPKNANLARQKPSDYLAGLEFTVKAAIAEAKKKYSEFSGEKVCGIGVDTTGSSPMPVLEDNSPPSGNTPVSRTTQTPNVGFGKTIHP